MKIPDLISATRRDVMMREFRCNGGSAPVPGAQVVLCRHGTGIAVLVGSLVVGAIVPSEAPALLGALAAGCGMLRARVTSRSAITPSFVVRLQVSP